MFKKGMVIAAGLLVAGVASAQGASSFVEGTVGFGKFDLGNTSGWTVDDKDNNWGITAGYMFNDNFGFEAGYRDLGSADGTISGSLSGTSYGKPFSATGTFSTSGDADGWLFGVRLNLPINDKFSVNARAGLYNWTADINAVTSGSLTYDGTVYAGNVTASKKFSDTDPYYGIGANYNLTKQLGVGIGYTKFDLGDIGVKNDSWDINLQYRF